MCLLIERRYLRGMGDVKIANMRRRYEVMNSYDRDGMIAGGDAYAQRVKASKRKDQRCIRNKHSMGAHRIRFFVSIFTSISMFILI